MEIREGFLEEEGVLKAQGVMDEKRMSVFQGEAGVWNIDGQGNEGP